MPTMSENEYALKEAIDNLRCEMDLKIEALRSELQRTGALESYEYQPHWKNGPHLSDSGERELERLHDAGLNVSQIAKRMRMTYPSVKSRVSLWKTHPMYRPSNKARLEREAGV